MTAWLATLVAATSLSLLADLYLRLTPEKDHIMTIHLPIDLDDDTDLTGGIVPRLATSPFTGDEVGMTDEEWSALIVLGDEVDGWEDYDSPDFGDSDMFSDYYSADDYERH